MCLGQLARKLATRKTALICLCKAQTPLVLSQYADRRCPTSVGIHPNKYRTLNRSTWDSSQALATLALPKRGSSTIRRLTILLQPARKLRCPRPAHPHLPAQLVPADGPAGADPVGLVGHPGRGLQLVLVGVSGLVGSPDCRPASRDRCRTRYGRRYRYGLGAHVLELGPAVVLEHVDLAP